MLLGNPKPKDVPMRKPDIVTETVPWNSATRIVENNPKAIENMSRFLRLTFPPIKLPTIDQKMAEPKSIAGPILLQEGFSVIASERAGKYLRSRKNQARVPELRRRIAANFFLGILMLSVKRARFKKSPRTC
jgi:hypothetical protein